MHDSLLLPFADPQRHARISDIIRRHSQNRRDIREVALADLNFDFAKKILDLGCGFGFMMKALSPHLPADAHVIGVDACMGNEAAYLSLLKKVDIDGEFIKKRIDTVLPWESRSFDMVITSYSLYFFIDALPDIARVLSPGGLFLSIAHSKTSFAGLFEATGLDLKRSPLYKLLQTFSAENGATHLGRFFERVERLDYSNDLCFESDQMEDLFEYVDFKMPMLLADGAVPTMRLQDLKERISASVSSAGRIIIEKDDAIFLCRGSKWQ